MLTTPSARLIARMLQFPEWQHFSSKKEPACCFTRNLIISHDYFRTREKPFVTILGGAKVSDKIGVIRNLLPKVNTLLIGGGMAYTFLKAKGIDIGKSLVEADKVSLAKELLAQAAEQGVSTFLPVDHIIGDSERKNPTICTGNIPADRMGLDIGPQTIAQFSQELKQARMVLWNGPVGLFEVEPYSKGSQALAQTLAEGYPRPRQCHCRWRYRGRSHGSRRRGKNHTPFYGRWSDP